MDTNKMREQFEMALLGVMRENHPDDILAIEDISGLRNGEAYSHDAVALSWWAWKASREAVVVELPPRKSIDHYCYDQGANCNAEGHNQCLAQAAAAIEAQGLKVAP